MTTYYTNPDGAFGDRRYDAAVAEQRVVCGGCAAAGRTVLAHYYVDAGGYAEPAYYCAAHRPRAAVEMCDCGADANAATGYCPACEAARGIPPALHLSPAAAHAARVIALRQLDAR